MIPSFSSNSLTSGIRFIFENEFDTLEILNKDLKKKPQKVRDYRLKTQEKYFRPYFSPFFDSYEMDYANTGKYALGAYGFKAYDSRAYLFVININTKYLIVEPLPQGKSPSIDETVAALERVFEKLERLFRNSPYRLDGETYINNLRADADRAFGQKFIQFLRLNGVKHFYQTDSKLINRNRCVDRVIRTIRDMIGQKAVRFFNTKYMEYIVNIYNNTPHAAYNYQFTPLEVQLNPDIEGAYIRHQKEELRKAKEQQLKDGLLKYKRGNILVVHIPKNKTPASFNKNRRVFSDLAIFQEYRNGNVICTLLDTTVLKNPNIELPIYFTRYVSKDLFTLPKIYAQQFEIRTSHTVD
jgi:hypothetical protein